MDELFRRAAEDYPLNTNSADWNAVLKKLSAKYPEKINTTEGNKKNYKRLLLFLLLLPIAWIGNDYFFHSNNQNVNNSFADKKRVPKNILHPTAAQSNTTKSGNINLKPTTVLQLLPGNQQASINSINQNNMLYKQKGVLQSVQSSPQTNDTGVADQSSYSSSEELTDKKEKVPVTVNNENGVKDIKNSNENFTATQPDDNKKENNIPGISIKNKNQKQKKEHGIYAGISISPDISTVKFQSVKNTGVTIGLLIGYQFNKKISLESGLAWNKKYYYSDGEYFNAKNIALPAYAQIKKLDGICKMIEVPVTIKYNFKSSTKTNLSVSGGMSSYIMKSESYNYTIESNGQQYPRSATYKNSSTNLLAVANISFGYNHRLGKGAMLRLEPYIKIPVKGVGIGKLPIMSSGINIAITKKLF